MAKKKGVEKVVEPEVTFEDIVAAGPEGMFVYPEVFEPLVQQGLVEVNPAITQGEAVACRATEFGLEQFYKSTTVEETKVSGFEIEDGIPVPESKVVRDKVYPFDALQPGQSFFVPNGEKDMVKSLASSVAAANSRYAVPSPDGATRLVKRGNNIGASVPVMVKTREYVVRADTKDGAAGARVFRLK